MLRKLIDTYTLFFCKKQYKNYFSKKFLQYKNYFLKSFLQYKNYFPKSFFFKYIRMDNLDITKHEYKKIIRNRDISLKKICF